MIPIQKTIHGVFITIYQGCQIHFNWGPHQPCGCLQRAECNFRTKCVYSLTVKRELALPPRRNKVRAQMKQGGGRVRPAAWCLPPVLYDKPNVH